MKKYNVGIIGYGWVATAHIHAINATSNAQVTAICSSRPLDASEVSKQWGTPIRTYTDLNLMLSDKELDIVSICS
ncbi:MAG: Gfo/Idh/MocA family oxidoreductase, partial [Bacteroidota bacterium]|nr:Gfo/Idh/MocA family oxidoreductase [Bacteroidota bacterium]